MSEATLGGVVLPFSITWANRHSVSSARMSSKRTLGGGLVLFGASVSEGTPIQLVGDQDSGWFERTQVEQLLALAETPLVEYLFDWHGVVSHTVVFDHTGGSACVFSPLVVKNPESDWFIGTINLITV